MMRFVLTCILCMLGIFPLFAEEPAKKVRTCRILYMERPVDAPSEAYMFDGEKSQKVSLPSLNFSPVIQLPLGKLTIGMTPQAITVPEEFPEGAPTVTIPATHTDIYLLVTSDPDNQVMPIRLVPISISDKLQPGETLWINLTPHRIAAKLGNRTFEIPPQKQTLGPPPLSNSGYYSADFRYQRNSNGKYLPIMHKSWWFDDTSRNLGFIIGTQAKLPKIFSIRDRRSAVSMNQSSSR